MLNSLKISLVAFGALFLSFTALQANGNGSSAEEVQSLYNITGQVGSSTNQCIATCQNDYVACVSGAVTSCSAQFDPATQPSQMIACVNAAKAACQATWVSCVAACTAPPAGPGGPAAPGTSGPKPTGTN